MEGRTIYFAYGSNLDPEGMRLRAPDSIKLGPAVLRNWRLVFRTVADIIPSPGDRVLGGLWILDPVDEESLDLYEGTPTFYEKISVPVTVEDDSLVREVMTYRMVESRSDFSERSPSPGYEECIADGYESFGWNREDLYAISAKSPNRRQFQRQFERSLYNDSMEGAAILR
jgi:hypothetical protein